MSISLEIGSISLNVVLILSLLFLVRQQKQKVAVDLSPSPAPPPQTFDLDSFSLVGNEWQHLGDTPTAYGCFQCGKWQNLDMRQFRHLPSGSIYAMLRHSCQEVATPEQHTDAIQIGGDHADLA